MENFVYKIISKARNKWIVTLIVMVSMLGAIMMLPTKLVRAKMLPGKSTNTYTIYVDTATNASISEARKRSVKYERKFRTRSSS